MFAFDCIFLYDGEDEGAAKLGGSVQVGLLVERTIFRTGEASLAVTLPIAWARHEGLRPGNKVEIIINDDLVVRAKARVRNRDKEKMSIHK